MINYDSVGQLGEFSFWANLAVLWCQLKTQLGMNGPGWPYSSVWWLTEWWSGGLSWNDLSSSRLAWVPSHVAFRFQRPTREGKPQGICTCQPSASVKFAHVLLTQASHMIKTRVNVEGIIHNVTYLSMDYGSLQQQSTRPSQHGNSVQPLSLLFLCFTEKSPQYNSA